MKLLLFFVAFASSLAAKSIYVAQVAAGADNGTSQANAKSIDWAGTEGNWGAGGTQINPGDTIELCGTLTTFLPVRAAGASSGSPTIIHFQPNAKFSSPVWGGTYGAIYIPSNCNYITVDGGTNGLIENTANGTSLANQAASKGVCMESCLYFTVKNLTISNIYVRSNTQDQSAGVYGSVGITCQSVGNSITNLTITNNIVHDAATGIDTDFGPGSGNYDIGYNTVYNCNWAGRSGDRGATSTLTGMVVHHNWFYGWSCWDEPPLGNGNVIDIGLHHNGFYIYSKNGGTVTNPLIHSNLFGPGWGGQSHTAGIYLEGYFSGCTLYNNVFYAAPGEYTSNGFITPGFQSTGGTINIYNNTFIGNANNTLQLAGATGQTINLKNNLGVGYGTGTYFYMHDFVSDTLNINNNLAYNYDPAKTYSLNAGGGGTYQTFAAWKALGYDTTPGVATNPLVNISSYILGVGSPAIGVGADLSGTFTIDKNGVTRTAPWDLGALKFIPATRVPSSRVKGAITVPIN